MRIGVLLGGCGHYDGTDVQEAVLTLLALEEAGERPLLLAPDRPHERTVDHTTGAAVDGEARSVHREAARLTQRPVLPLSEARPDDLQALIIPGGYGPVVNFVTGFARAGAEHRLVPEIEAFLRHFLDAGKPIGTVSLGEVPLRRALGQEVDLDPPPDDPARLRIDPERRLVHTPGSAGFTRLQEVRAGITAMVREVLRLAEERARRGAPAGTAAPEGR